MSDKAILKDKKVIMIDDLLTWTKAFETIDVVVKKDKINGIKISTVFLGLNHSFDDNCPDLWFETMIFGGKHDQYQDRYETWDQAEIGHQKAIDLVTSKQ